MSRCHAVVNAKTVRPRAAGRLALIGRYAAGQWAARETTDSLEKPMLYYNDHYDCTSRARSGAESALSAFLSAYKDRVERGAPVDMTTTTPLSAAPQPLPRFWH